MNKTKVLAELVAEVIKTGDKTELPEERSKRFHQEFEAEVSGDVEKMRAEKRRAYEDAKNFVVQ